MFPPPRQPRHMNQPYYHGRPPFHSSMNSFGPPHYSQQGFHPYPQQKKPSKIKAAFVDENGSFNVGKTINTVDQVVKTVHQVTPLVKQVSSFFIKR